MSNLTRWAEEAGERRLDRALHKMRKVFSNVEIHLIADAFSRGLPHTNAEMLINAFAEVGEGEENQPFHFIDRLDPEDFLSQDSVFGLIIGRAAIKQGKLSDKLLSEALAELEIPLTPEQSSALNSKIKKPGTSDSHIDIEDVITVLFGAMTVKDLATKIPWKVVAERAAVGGRAAIAVGRRLILKR